MRSFYQKTAHLTTKNRINEPETFATGGYMADNATGQKFVAAGRKNFGYARRPTCVSLTDRPTDRCSWPPVAG
jgi:hypothetical protein